MVHVHKIESQSGSNTVSGCHWPPLQVPCFSFLLPHLPICKETNINMSSVRAVKTFKRKRMGQTDLYQIRIIFSNPE